MTLLERTSRRVALTAAGAVLLEQGRIAVEAAGAAIERTRRPGTQVGRLTVAVKPGTGTELLKKIIQRCARNPLVPEVHLLFGHPGGPACAVRQGAADVAILRASFDFVGDALTVAVFDAETFDDIFRDMVDANEEGAVVKDGKTLENYVFDDTTIECLLTTEAIAPSGAACLKLACRHHAALLP